MVAMLSFMPRKRLTYSLISSLKIMSSVGSPGTPSICWSHHGWVDHCCRKRGASRQRTSNFSSASPCSASSVLAYWRQLGLFLVTLEHVAVHIFCGSLDDSCGSLSLPHVRILYRFSPRCLFTASSAIPLCPVPAAVAELDTESAAVLICVGSTFSRCSGARQVFTPFVRK
jgi:hypothetical protein